MNEFILRTEETDHFTLRIRTDLDFGTIRSLEADGLGCVADADDPGYLVLPRGRGCDDYCLFYFNRHGEDFETEIRESNVPFFGVRSAKGTWLAAITGMSYDYTLKILRKNGAYYCYPVFDFSCGAPYEEPRVEYYPLSGEDADYSGMARRYRALEIERRGLRPIRERLGEQPALAYAMESPYLRIRLAWKPAPAEQLHQTVENEPEMHIACDFDRVGDLLDELARQKVGKAELCLVGWNVSGHDGRWPQAFPVEPRLGGEERLRALIRKAETMGYAITAHTNSSDQYEIAENYSADNVRRDAEGKPVVNEGEVWSGGQMSQLCPKIGYEQACETLPRLAGLGFRGLHYVDVLGTVHPRSCSHPLHPVNKGQCRDYAGRLAELSRELFGGFATEGCYEYLAPHVDFGLYASFARDRGFLCDRSIPFLELVFHGFLLYNAFSDTVNAPFKDRNVLLKAIEYGSRPTFYFYAAFMRNGNNWMGVEEPRCGTAEELRDSVAKIRQACEEFAPLVRLQTLFMERHEQVAEDVFEATYSDGTVLRVDYGKQTWSLRESAGKE